MNVTAENPLPRMRWRCRRGMKELDRLLLHYLDDYAPTATPDQLALFDSMLDAEDTDLWYWFMGRTRSERADWQTLIETIRASYRP
jgi:antitoxin CptB